MCGFSSRPLCETKSDYLTHDALSSGADDNGDISDLAQTNSAFCRHLVNRQTDCVNSFCGAAEDIQCWYHMSVCTSVCARLLLLVSENSRWINAIRCNTLKTKCLAVVLSAWMGSSQSSTWPIEFLSLNRGQLLFPLLSVSTLAPLFCVNNIYRIDGHTASVAAPVNCSTWVNDAVCCQASLQKPLS